MKTHLLEATNGPHNWGKFLIGDFTDERAAASVVDPTTPTLWRAVGLGENAYLVLDLQTREGAMFRLGGLAAADLNKHKIWVCPLFEPMLTWLYDTYRAEPDRARWWARLPHHVDLPDAPFALAGYRREGR